MASCVANIPTKNYQNLVVDFQGTVENVGDAFLGHSVVPSLSWPEKSRRTSIRSSYCTL